MPCALQDGVIARKKISDVFPKPKHIGVSLLVWYLFCGVTMTTTLDTSCNGFVSKARVSACMYFLVPSIFLLCS
jgi:hypothetical protein